MPSFVSFFFSLFLLVFGSISRTNDPLGNLGMGKTWAELAKWMEAVHSALVYYSKTLYKTVTSKRWADQTLQTRERTLSGSPSSNRNVVENDGKVVFFCSVDSFLVPAVRGGHIDDDEQRYHKISVFNCLIYQTNRENYIGNK